MSLSQSAALNVVPLLARLVLAAVFIPAGYNKLMKEAEFSGEEAKRLRELSVIASSSSSLTGSQSGIPPAVALANPLVGQSAPPKVVDPAAPSKPTTDETPVTNPPAKPTDGTTAAPPVAGEPVKARALHRVTIMVDKAGWPYQTWLAWLAAVTEFVGGICLVLGLFTRMWGLGLAVTMGVAFYLTSYDQVLSTMVIGMPVDGFTRYSSQIALFALAFGLFLTGAGSGSIDRRLSSGGGSGGGKKPASDG